MSKVYDWKRFETYRHLWPPRPTKAVPPVMLGYFEKQGWVAQVKFNGTCNVLGVTPDRQIRATTRHGTPHKLWIPDADSARAFQSLPGKGWYVFVAHLIHSKVPGIRSVNYIHDLLVVDGELLYGKTYTYRLHVLTDLFTDQIEPSDEQERRLSHLVIDRNTWLAKSHHHEFRKLFDAHKQIAGMEGLVLKNPWAELKACLRPDATWQVQCRKPTKSYGF